MDYQLSTSFSSRYQLCCRSEMTIHLMPWESYTICRCAKLLHMTIPFKASKALNEQWLCMCKQSHVHIRFFKFGCKGTNKVRNLFA